MSELTAKIDDAFTRPDPQDAIRLVKAAVHEELNGMDRGIGLEETPFFNHAIYPDMVLRWHESGLARERPLFLRFEVAEGTMGQDLRLHGSKDPMFIGLLDHRDEPVIPETQIEAEPEAERAEDIGELPEPAPGGALLAEASAIDLLEDFARQRPVQIVATSAIARGGHGRLSAASAIELGDALGAGFDAASEARDPELVMRAFTQLEDLIAPRQAEQLATHLQLLWLGSGGDLADLFGEGRLEVESLSDLQMRELLEHLLTREEAPSATTLRRFSSAIDPDRLGTLLGTFDGGHLGALVEANASHWEARWVQVREGGLLGWYISNDLLKLGLGSLHMTFTSRGKKLARYSDGHAVRRTHFTARLERDQTISLDMVSDEAEVELRRRAGTSNDVKLRPEQIDALGELAESVLRGTVLSPTLVPGGTAGDGMEVEIDYARALCAFADPVPLRRAMEFAARYFGNHIHSGSDLTASSSSTWPIS